MTEEKKKRTLREIVLEGYRATIAEAERCQEFIDWKNSLGPVQRLQLYVFQQRTPTTQEIMEKYEEIFDRALELVKDNENRNRLLVKKQWFDGIKAKYGKKQQKKEEETLPQLEPA
jgi:hypothetical protein